jgi:hypothetical protein
MDGAWYYYASLMVGVQVMYSSNYHRMCLLLQSELSPTFLTSQLKVIVYGMELTFAMRNLAFL